MHATGTRADVHGARMSRARISSHAPRRRPPASFARARPQRCGRSCGHCAPAWPSVGNCCPPLQRPLGPPGSRLEPGEHAPLMHLGARPAAAPSSGMCVCVCVCARAQVMASGITLGADRTFYFIIIAHVSAPKAVPKRHQRTSEHHVRRAELYNQGGQQLTFICTPHL